jgi:hypothetical protein
MVLHKQSHLVSAPRKTCWEWHGVAMTGIVLKSSTVRKWGGGRGIVVEQWDNPRVQGANGAK